MSFSNIIALLVNEIDDVHHTQEKGEEAMTLRECLWLVFYACLGLVLLMLFAAAFFPSR